jgi:hypothetical protein
MKSHPRPTQKNIVRLASLAAIATTGLVLSSCADEATPTSVEGPLFSRVDRAEASQGEARTWSASLRPLNADFSYRPVHGTANFKMKDGILTVRVNASGLQPGMPHAQHVHLAASCPTADADGGDGIVSLPDGIPFYGGVLFWLDGDLANPGPDFTTLPNPDNAGGAITFSTSVAVADLEAAAGQPLDLANRTVVLHGVAADTDLSADPAAQANPAVLPVACGTID